MPTPTRVQHVSCSNSNSNALSSYVIELPNPSLSGNLLVVGITWSAGTATASVADDIGNTYTAGTSGSDANQKYQVFYKAGATSGARKITITFSGGTPSFVQGCASEYYNVATSSPSDGGHAGSGISGTLAAGSFSTTADGDLIYQFGLMEIAPGSSNTFAAGSGFTMISEDTYDAFAVQETIQTTHGAINPSMAVSPSNSWGTVAMAFKAAAAGTAPGSGIRIVGMHHCNVQVGSSPLSLRFPCFGNLLVCSWSGNPSLGGDQITSIADTVSNTWAAAGAVKAVSSSGEAMLYYAGNATPSSTLTVNISRSGASGTGTCLVFYDVLGADPSPFDNYQVAGGNQATIGTITAVSITPSRVNGLIITNLSHESRTETSISPGQFDSMNINPAPASLSPSDENNGFAHEYNSDTASRTYVWSGSATTPGNWASVAAAFKGNRGNSTMAVSPVDSRTSKPNSATFRTVQGSQIDDVQTSSNSAIPPTDSRAAGALVDSRIASIIPQNSRAALG